MCRRDCKLTKLIINEIINSSVINNYYLVVTRNNHWSPNVISSLINFVTMALALHIVIIIVRYFSLSILIIAFRHWNHRYMMGYLEQSI